MPEPNEWHLDKRVPLALIFAIFFQTAGAVWWASGISERITQVERRLESAIVRSEATDAALARQGQDIAVVAAQLVEQNRQLDRLYTQVEATNALLREYLTRGAPTR